MNPVARVTLGILGGGLAAIGYFIVLEAVTGEGPTTDFLGLDEDHDDGKDSGPCSECSES